MPKKIQKSSRSGFTLLEVLLVVAIIAVLAGIVIVAINPAKQLADSRNSQRKSDVNTILSATYQYMIDNAGNIPTGIAESASCDTPATNEICKTGAASCTGLVDMSDLTAGEKYLVSLPSDPSNPAANVNGTGYFIAKSVNGRLTVCAPQAEDLTITVTR